MTPEELFAIWAPTDSVWSAWAKPVLFVQSALTPPFIAPSTAPSLPPPLPPIDYRSLNVTWAPDPMERTPVIVDLPGPDAVATGIALAARGYRPVPLFNACTGSNEVVAIRPIVDALVRFAPDLRGFTIAPEAPPAFLLDSDRRTGTKAAVPGTLDNRWIVFPQDFPSAARLRSLGAGRSIVVQTKAADASPDLSHVLVRWQEAGLPIFLQSADAPAPVPITVETPSRFRGLAYRVFAAMGFRRASAGGFGAVIPIVTHSGSSSGYRGGFS